MSDDIQCAVDGCKMEAEIEVIREGASLWVCGKHHRAFRFPVSRRIAELEAQKDAALIKIGKLTKLNTGLLARARKAEAKNAQLRELCQRWLPDFQHIWQEEEADNG